MSEPTVTCARSGRIIEPHETAFVVDGEVVCREVHDELRPVCPYCGEALPAKPAPYSPCPHCRETILVRTNQDLYDSTLLTRAQSDEFDRTEAIVRPFKLFDIRTRDYVMMKDKLRDAMELDRDATDGEIIWQLFHEAARRISLGGESAATRRRLADLYLLQARFVHAQGKDHRPIQQKWARTLLHAYRAEGVTHVQLRGLPEDCLPSRRLHGQVVSIEDAIFRPPLPCGDCNHKLLAAEVVFRGETLQTLKSDAAHATTRLTVSDRPFCECRYEPATDPAAQPAGATAMHTATGGDSEEDEDPGADLLKGL